MDAVGEDEVHEEHWEDGEDHDAKKADKAVNVSEIQGEVVIVPIAGAVADCVDEPAADELDETGDEKRDHEDEPGVLSELIS